MANKFLKLEAKCVDPEIALTKFNMALNTNGGRLIYINRVLH